MDDNAITIIAGVVGSVVALNLILLIAWCLLKRRQPRARQKQPDKKALKPSSLLQMTQTQPPNYMNLVLSVQDSRRKSLIETPPSAPRRLRPKSVVKSDSQKSVTHPPTSVQQTKQALASLDTDLIKQKVRPPPLSLCNAKAPVIAVNEQHLESRPVMDPGASLKRAFSVRSADSASVYSVASAAAELHERTFRPWALNPLSPIPASPLSPSHLDLLPQGNEVSLIKEELAPETYNKDRRVIYDMYQPISPRSPPFPSSPSHGRRISGNSNIPPVPPLPPRLMSPISPITPLSSLSAHKHSRSTSSGYPRTITPTSIDTPPPRIPPRSPLRNVQSQWLDS